MYVKFWNLLLVLLSHELIITASWKQWDYTTYWAADSTTTPQDEENAWSNVWKNASNPPRPRKGASLVIMEIAGSSYLVLFGGRDNDRSVKHIPKTFNVEKVYFLIKSIE